MPTQTEILQLSASKKLAFSAPPQTPVYVLNLDRSPDRLDHITQSAKSHSVNFIRVCAVDGARIAESDRSGLNEKKFRRLCGRPSLPGEYGVYRSHLKALEMIAAGADEHAVILEDDTEFSADFCEKIDALKQHIAGPAMIKLVNHRNGGFLPLTELTDGDEIGVCWMGPQGSAAGYLVTKAAAARLVKRLAVMSLPFDVALERAWSTGVRLYTVKNNVISFANNQRGETLIATSEAYRKVKFNRFFRVPSYLFKNNENFARACYAFLTLLLNPLRSTKKSR